MDTDRNIQILTAGLKAAHERVFSAAGLRRLEHPRGLQQMYSNMEDDLFSLFNAVKDKRYALVREAAADIIVTASKIVEYAELLSKAASEPWNKRVASSSGS
jgi:hypothetical protein